MSLARSGVHDELSSDLYAAGSSIPQDNKIQYVRSSEYSQMICQCLKNNELEGMWKDAAIAKWKYYPGICLEKQINQ
jgi:hypothetical protein